MRLIIDSDFNDWYDTFFDSAKSYNGVYITLVRDSCDYSYSKTMALVILGKIYKVPIHGLVTSFDPDTKVVVYEDQYAHAGEGKILTTPRQCKNKELECSLYMKPDEPGTAFRYLRVGIHNFHLRYKSNTWMSNMNPDITAQEMTPADLQDFSLINQCGFRQKPLLALDYVVSGGQKYFLDINTAPGIPREEVGLRASEIYTGILQFIKETL